MTSTPILAFPLKGRRDNTTMPNHPAYAELHCLSNFSFLRGASHPEELVEQAATLGYHAIALTDECSVAGVVRGHVAAKAAGLKFIVGSEIHLADGPKLVLLATDRAGYGALCHLISLGRRAAAKGRYHLTRADLADGLPGCLALLVPEADPDPEHALWFMATFPGRGWLAVELHAGADDRHRLRALSHYAQATGLPMVATGDVHMHRRSRRILQDTLTAIRLGRPVKDCGHALFANGERHLRSLRRLAGLYPPELLAAGVAIAERCRFSLDSLRYEYPAEVVPPGSTPTRHLRALTENGLAIRYPDGVPDRVRGLVEHELALIAELGYEHYFLTVHDIVAYARSRAILCQGRGSAANSAVCYALGITEVDPARMAMLFERFISRERNEPPDIDVDFEHERREEVIQYLYGKYGRDRATLAATVITYRPKSALRDVGKALGFDLDQVDRLARSQTWWDGRQVRPERLAEAGFDPAHGPVARLIDIVGTLVGFPRHLSQHVGGFVISRGPLSELVPVENAAMADRTVIQWDKDDLDALGLMKVDVLALGMLSAIRRALDLVNGWHGRDGAGRRPIAMADIPPEDPAVYDMIGAADTVGVFQIESRAQMAMLPRMRPRRFYDLVIEVAIVRPGPIQGGMVHPYLARRQGKEPVSYPSEAVRGVLRRTLGVPIFQEQVMQLAVVAAGFTPGEADRLRRSMAAWRRRGGLEGFEEKLVSGMLERGYGADFAQAIYRQILGFGEYGFPESHAASFALLVYVSAWLKCHEPAAFTCALLNSQPMGFYSPSQLIQDARRHGIEVRPVAAAASQWDCTLEPSEAAPARPAIRLGLRLVKGLGRLGAARLVTARGQAPYADIQDLARRAGLEPRDLAALAEAGALAGLAGHRRSALWQVAGAEVQLSLIQEAGFAEADPALPAPSEGEDIVADYASLGLTLGRHPLALLRPGLRKRRLMNAAEIRRARPGSLVRTTGIVTCRQHPATASGVTFVTLEDETGMVNVVVWRDLAERQRKELLGASLLGVYGVLERDGEVVHVIARRLVDHSSFLGELVTHSRDFH
jgi:error-prone DNA polymerase